MRFLILFALLLTAGCAMTPEEAERYRRAGAALSDAGNDWNNSMGVNQPLQPMQHGNEICQVVDMGNGLYQQRCR